MKFDRFFPWMDLVVYGVLSLVVTGLAVGAALTPQAHYHTAGTVLLALVPASFWGLMITQVLRKWSRRPDYVDASGWALWVDEGLGITVLDMARRVEGALAYFRKEVCLNWKHVSDKGLRRMIAQLRIEIVEGPIPFGEKEYNGLQKGYHLKVRWLGGFKHNAFFHELMHAVDETVKGDPPDYKHERGFWWDSAAKMSREFPEHVFEDAA